MAEPRYVLLNLATMEILHRGPLHMVLRWEPAYRASAKSLNLPYRPRIEREVSLDSLREAGL